MKTFFALTKRNVKVFFKDKGLFFSSLITPIILLVLYSTILANVYKESFRGPDGFETPDKLLNGLVTGELVSSLLAVTCVTVAFCSNLLMIQDITSGARNDLLVSPIKSPVLSVSYFTATFLSTIIVSLTAAAACFVYTAIKGWYLSFADVTLIISDVVLLTLVGTALSSCVNVFLTTNGQASAVGTIVSAGYGFLCGAYMPIASFSPALRNIIMFLPGTYGTALVRNHALSGALNELGSLIEGDAARAEVLKNIKDGVDCNVYFFGDKVEIWVMYLVLAGATLLLLGLYVLLGKLLKKHK